MTDPTPRRPSDGQSPELLKPLVRATASQLEIVARETVEGAVVGLHRSPYQGRNVEFSEHRPYNPGDELRLIDWRSTLNCLKKTPIFRPCWLSTRAGP